MKDFNIAKYLKENHLGSHAILGRYVDLHALKEESQLNEASLELDWASGIDSLKAKCKKHGLSCKVVQEKGPAGLNPLVKIMGSKDSIVSFLKDGYADADQLEDYIADIRENLEEAPDYNNISPERLKGLADAGDFTAQRILKKKNDDADQRMKAQDSTPNDDGDCPQGMTPDPVYGCIREREEGLEDWEMVKKLATKDKSVAAAFLKPLVTVYGKDNVKIVKQGDFYKIYTKGKEELNKEADYGNNEPVDEVPYTGAEEKLDGFGDEFDQVDPVEEMDNSITGDKGWQYDDDYEDDAYHSEMDKYDRMMNRAHEYFEKVSPIVRKTIDALRADGFSDQDIVDFMATDFTLENE